jgi:hypothetical protein
VFRVIRGPICLGSDNTIHETTRNTRNTGRHAENAADTDSIQVLFTFDLIFI